jgi:hypothetical protein
MRSTAIFSLFLFTLLIGTPVSALQPGVPRAMTMWWLFYNNPSACVSDTSHGATEKCGPVDVFGQPFLDSVEAGAPDPSLIAPNTAAGLGVVYATGGVTDNRGNITLVASAYLGDADPSASLDLGGAHIIDPMGLATGFENTGAEVHIVLRDHGPVIPGQITTQITNFLEPNCADPLLLWDGGPNTCQDVQFAIFGPGEEGYDNVVSFDHLGNIQGASAYFVRNGDAVMIVVRSRVPLQPIPH